MKKREVEQNLGTLPEGFELSCWNSDLAIAKIVKSEIIPAKYVGGNLIAGKFGMSIEYIDMYSMETIASDDERLPLFKSEIATKEQFFVDNFPLEISYETVHAMWNNLFE